MIFKIFLNDGLWEDICVIFAGTLIIYLITEPDLM